MAPTAPADPAPAETDRDLFDRRRRAVRRSRRPGPRGDWFTDQMAAMVLDRLEDVTRTFERVLVIGARTPALQEGLARIKATAAAQVQMVEQSSELAAASGALLGEEDRLPVEPESVDCILWPGGLESVNDVPGALLRCRLALKGDGLLLGCFPGDGSFPALREALRIMDGERAVARMHPQIDTRAMGDLLSRIGMTMAVADTEKLSLAYTELPALIADLRGAAWTNLLKGPIQPIGKAGLAKACQAFAAARDASGRTVEHVRIVHYSGWAPHPDQPQPARRGSATVSLKTALKRD
jgi:SAM-dependent methyltransferase